MGTTLGARTVHSSGEPELTTGIECGSLPHPKGIIRINKSTDNTVAKRKRKGQIMIYKTLCRKLKLEKHEPPLKIRGEHRCSGRISSSYSTSGTHRICLVTDSFPRRRVAANKETTEPRVLIG
jgi:hypothetical protein